MQVLKSLYAVVLIVSLGAMAVTTAVPYLEQVFADPDTKYKSWVSEDGIVGGIECFKDNGGCKDVKEEFGDNVNKVAREACEGFSSGEKCKQEKK